jgi:hypothetical protein
MREFIQIRIYSKREFIQQVDMYSTNRVLIQIRFNSFREFVPSADWCSERIYSAEDAFIQIIYLSSRFVLYELILIQRRIHTTREFLQPKIPNIGVFIQGDSTN